MFAEMSARQGRGHAAASISSYYGNLMENFQALTEATHAAKNDSAVAEVLISVRQ